MKAPSLQDCEDFLKGIGPTNSLDAALVAKMNAQQLRELARREAESAKAYLAAKEKQKANLAELKEHQKQTGDYTLAGFNKAKAAQSPSAKPVAPAKASTAIPAKPSTPAARPTAPKASPPASKTPTLDQFNKLKGEQAALFYRENRSAIRREEMQRNFPGAIVI